MNVAPTKPKRPRRLAALLLGVGVGVGAIIVSAWGDQRRLHDAYFPQMAESAFVGADGKEIFVQMREVTIAEWNRCHADGACTLKLRPPVQDIDADYPATGISWVDANEYLTWINHKSRHSFRLPTAAEWSAMAAPVIPEKPDPIFTDPELTWASTYLTEGLVSRRLEPSGSFSKTAEGIDDLDGNVWEWTQDCYAGSAGREPLESNACPAFIVGGEHEAVIPFLVRDPARGGCAVGAPPPHLGMRLVSDQALPGT